MSRKLSGGMQVAQQRLKMVHQEIQDLQFGRTPVKYVPLCEIVSSPFQARIDFTGLDTLVRDIQANGILQPLLGRRLTNGKIELIAGERRWRAAQQAGLSEIPIMLREASDEQARLYGLRENLERQDLNAFEVATTTLALIGLSLNISPTEVRGRLVRRGQADPDVERALEDALVILGRDLTRQSFVNHYLPLLDLPEILLDAIRDGASFNAVRLLRRASPEQQAAWLTRIQSGEWGVRDVEAALKASPKAIIQGRGEGHKLMETTQRIFKMFSAKRLTQLDAGKQKKLQKLLSEVEVLLQEK